MNYHNILHDNMLNGDGLRVVLFVSGCIHNCDGCHNPETHDFKSGIPFDESAKDELFEQLSKDYIQGITISGGDPLHPSNAKVVLGLCQEIKEKYPQKDIWIYTGYEFPELPHEVLVNAMKFSDVIVTGRYNKQLTVPKPEWCGSQNQKIWRKHG